VEPIPRTRASAGLAAVLALTALAALSLWTVLPPAPRGTDTPADEFSAARAYSHVERLGVAVHVAGSSAGDGVRTYLQTTMGDLGLRTEVQDAVGGTDALGGYAMARVRNVLAIMPGTDPTGRIFVVAHYDSVQVSYGANDDGAGVATMLEAARAMAQGQRPRNDIIFLFTDAEEACLCGAEAFVSQHQLGGGGGVVLNLEARGSSGPVVMFETSEGNARLVDVYGAAAPHPVATSFAVEVYRILPNDTDFTPFRTAELANGRRFTGLNSAYIDGSAVYHSPQDAPSYMDTASLQHHGDNALALARAFGAADLRPLATPAANDATYFPMLTLLVRYPGWLVWPLAGLALVGVIVLIVVARRRELASLPRVAAGFGLGLVPLLVAPVLAQLLWTVLVAVRPGYAEMIDPWRPEWFRAAVVALVAAVVLTWYGLLRRRIGAWPLALGALLWLAALGLVLAWATPGGSYLAVLPALGGSAAGIAAVHIGRPAPRLAVLVAGGAVGVLILAPTILLFFPALGLATGAAAAFFATLLGLAILPVLEALYPIGANGRHRGRPSRLRGSAPAGLAAVLAAGFLTTGLVVDRFDAAHPVPAQLMYVLDTDTNRARWVSAEASPGEWTRQYVTGREDLSEAFPIFEGDLATGPATVAPLPAPGLGVDADSVAGGERTLTLRVVPNRPARLVFLGVDAPVLRATVAGRDVPDAELTDGLGLTFHAPPPEGVAVTIVLARPGPVRIRVMDGSDGLTGLPEFRPRPAGVGVEGSHDSELVLVAKTYMV
jgi:hypothetical protein